MSFTAVKVIVIVSFYRTDEVLIAYLKPYFTAKVSLFELFIHVFNRK